MDNANSREYLQKILDQVLENMRKTTGAPSVQMTEIPRESLGMGDDEEAALDDLDEDENPDKRITSRRADKYTSKNGELSDSEDEEMEDVNGRPSARRKRRNQNYRPLMEGGVDSGVETGSGMGSPQLKSSLPDEANDMDLDADLDAIRNGTTNGSTAQSPINHHDDDIEMDDADAPNGDTSAEQLPSPPEESTGVVQQQQTPPDSPPTLVDETSPTLPAAALMPGTTMTTLENQVAESTVPVPSVPESVATGAMTEDITVKQEVTGDDPLAQAQEEGRMEREAANAEGEANTEAVAKIEAEGGTDAGTIVPVNGDGSAEGEGTAGNEDDADHVS
jgi:histone deacetylase 1/2